VRGGTVGCVPKGARWERRQGGMDTARSTHKGLWRGALYDTSDQKTGRAAAL